MDKDDWLDKLCAVIEDNHPPENAPLPVKASMLFDAIAATQSLLGILISLYQDATGKDVTEAVLIALRNTLTSLDEDD